MLRHLKAYYEESKEHQEHLTHQPYRFYQKKSQEDVIPPPNVALIGAGVSNHFVRDLSHSLVPQQIVKTSFNPSYNHLFQNNASRSFPSHFRPKGLINNNENLCFFNCVLQVLARTDGLLRDLMRVTVATRKEGQVLDEMVKVLASLTNPEPYFSKPSSIDTSHLRKLLIHSFNNSNNKNVTKVENDDFLSWVGKWLGWTGGSGCMLEEPSSGLQKEEDVAELFMWLMHQLEVELMQSNTRTLLFCFLQIFKILNFLK